MAVKTIKASGGDYTTLTAWESALPATLTQVEEAECYDFSVSGEFVINGITTAADKYVRVYTPLSERHDGRPRSVSGRGFQILDTVANNGAFRLGPVNHVRIEGLEIYHDSTTSTAVQLANSLTVGGNDIRIENCLIHNRITGTAYTLLFTAGNLALKFRNNIVYGNCRSMDSRGAASVVVENCTFWRHAAQLGLVGSAELTCKNTYSGHTGAAAEDFWTGGTSPTGNNNASSDTSQATDYTSGISSVAGADVFVSVTSGSENFNLKAGTNALVDAGATLTSTTTDAIGTARPQGSAYDIGALERIVASAGSTIDLTAAALTSAGQAFGAALAQGLEGAVTALAAKTLQLQTTARAAAATLTTSASTLVTKLVASVNFAVVSFSTNPLETMLAGAKELSTASLAFAGRTLSFSGAVGRRALAIISGRKVRIPDAGLGAGHKPLVVSGERQKLRQAAEGLPVVVVEERLKGLPDGDSLES